MTEIRFGTYQPEPDDPILPNWWRTIDHLGIAAVLILFAIGLLLSFAASPPLAEKHSMPVFHYVQRHAVFGIAALMAMAVVSIASPTTVRRIGIGIFGISFLGLMLLPGFGTDFGKGAVRWFSFGFGSIQPSEFLKPGFVVFSAWLISVSMESKDRRFLLLSLGVTGLIAAALALQPDFGQASLVVFSWCILYFASGGPILILVLIGAIVVSAGLLAFHLSEHVQSRIVAYLEGNAEPNSQLGFAEAAFREGGTLGVGLGNGTVKFQLPDGHTDFIAAVAAEEYGLVMVVAIIALFCFVCVRSLYRLLSEKDDFIRLAGTGLAALFAIQAFINLGVSVQLLPAKGMTLPLVSYGGSSMIAVGLALGMLFAFTRERPRTGIGDILRQGA